ncbi:MAG: 5'-methylthioadenosine/S-adenosylhomocysteine nucleosidase [Epulopiscium sp. Nele67-Bin005]|nr:MAG: 5'-methylthioadenosine/S-adenosylhomocysteine nucleosidase [Epulopiscium sp. Nele67-Bin005]
MQKIGIIGAMDEEVIALKRKMEIEETVEKASMTFCSGTLKNKQVVVVKCGIGKVNSAVCTQVLIDHFNVDCIINTGVAGGLHPDINIGDIVISSDTVQHDMDTTAFGDPKGTIPRMDKSFFEADGQLIELAKEAANTLSGEHEVYVGRVASGDQFVCSIEVKEDIYSTFTAYCAEMEGAAIAHVCYLNQIPFVIIRAISDKADYSAEVNFEDFTELAARNATAMINSIIEKI